MTQHVVLKPPATFMCLHCGERYDAAMPARIEVFSAMSKAFEKSHKKCPQPETGPACSHCGGLDHPNEKCPRTDYEGDPHRWAAGPDTGLSSMTIWRKLMGFPVERADFPWDPDDFGRCHRLLRAIPGWRARIGEMATVPGWEKLAPAWDELEALYTEERPSGRAPRLYKRMCELRGER